MVIKRNKVLTLGAFAYQKYGPENITLSQLAQAEAAGCFLPELHKGQCQILHFEYGKTNAQKQLVGPVRPDEDAKLPT